MVGGWRRRWRQVRSLVLACLLTAQGCSSSSEVSPTTTSDVPPPTVSRTAPPSTSVAESTSTDLAPETAPSTEAPVELPPLDSSVLPATLEIVNGNAVSSWLIQIEDATARSGEATSISCAEIVERAPELDAAASQNVVDIPEPVLQELLLNLDASLGAAAELCTAGDEAGAFEEWAAAVEIADVVAERLEQMR